MCRKYLFYNKNQSIFLALPRRKITPESIESKIGNIMCEILLQSVMTTSEKYKVRRYRLTCLAVVIAALLMAKPSCADEATFNPNALEIDNPSETAIDLTQFASSGSQPQGKYRVDIYMNGERKDTLEINFVQGANNSLAPQLTPAQLEEWGVILSGVSEMTGVPKNTVITDLPHYIPQASANFDFPQQALNISVPQALMRQSAQGSVDPKYWDEGINALLLDYGFTGSNSWENEGDGTSDSYFMSLHSGANLGVWRLRNYSTWSYSKAESNGTEDTSKDNTRSKWDSINTFLQRAIPQIKGQFTVGDSYTPSDVFDSVQFRGAQLVSDDNMLPDSLRGFAPTVRGIANSNARVTIKQNGSVIYQTYVSPGAFIINDLFPTSSSGDLQVTITEADGSERTFVQPFSNVPMMQREGRLKYGFTVGEYRSQSDKSNDPILGQATLVYGLPHDMTVYGGLEAADSYKAMALGLGFSLGTMGSVSMDATQSYTKLDENTKNSTRSPEGQSYRFQYSKDIAATDSTVTLAGYRYSTEGFYTFQEAMDFSDTDNNNYTNSHNNKRSKLQLELTQNIMNGDWGSMSFSGYQQDYWNEQGYERNMSVSYSNSVWNGISWTLMYTYTELTDSNEPDNQQLALNVSIPLSKWLPGSYASTNMISDMHGAVHSQTGISGTALKDHNLAYSVAQGYGNRGEGYSGAVNGDYRGTYGEINAGYNYNGDSRQVNYGARGSLLVHPHGVTLGQPLSGDMTSLALVEAPGASGVTVQNGTGLRTDWRGYAIVPYLTPYKRSRIGLDPGSLSENVDLKENVTSVVPTAGAVVRASFKTNIGSRVLMTLMHNGRSVPFGVLVSVDGNEGDNTGIVGDNGQVYLSGVPQTGTLTATWGTKKPQQCHVHFTLLESEKNEDEAFNSVQLINLNCE